MCLLVRTPQRLCDAHDVPASRRGLLHKIFYVFNDAGVECDGAWEHAGGVSVHGGHVMAAWVADEKGRGGMKVVMCYAIHIYVSIRDMKYDVCVCDEACAM